MRATKENILEYLTEVKFEFLKEGIVKIALFGSYAKDTQNIYSDIDIAIAKDHDFLKHKSSYDYFDTVNQLKEKITKKFHRNVDVYDLDNAGAFKKSIDKELIYV
jgi:predicted nucleotidyltransferase